MDVRTYRAAIFRDVKHIDVIDRPYPVCGDDEVILRNLMAGICGSDVAAYHHGGDASMIWKDHEFGHEVVSEVVAMGKDVQGLALGDRVFPNQGNVYRDRNRMATVGAFSEYIHVVQCEVGYSVLKIDHDIPVDTAVLLEPFVVGARGVKGLDPAPGHTAIVFGAGVIGMSAAIMLKWYGCDKVMIVDVSASRLANAEKFGLMACNSAQEDLKAKAIREFGLHQGVTGDCCGANLYVDAIGKQVAMDNFALLACREAKLSVIGVHHEPPSINMLALCYSNWQITGCGNTPTADAVKDIQSMMRSGQFDLSLLISHKFRLEEIEQALVMGANVQHAQKVCITFD